MGKQKYPNTNATHADGVAVKRGREHYSHDKADARQDKRRQEAEARQREYDKLTPAQKLEREKALREKLAREGFRG
jgi:hypothetical protein